MTSPRPRRPAATGPTTPRPPRSRRRAATTWGGHLVLAAVAYIPLLRTAPGQVGADTKLYLYLHPTRFMSQVASMWDPDVAMGTVTHQFIGYLLPMGPYYALMQGLGVPTWVAQRLWTGSLLFLAGAGVLFLLRTLSPDTGVPGAGSLDFGTVGALGALVAALAYMLSPYVLQNEARASVLLLPWVGLPWMVGLVARALRQGGWRHPALFAVVLALVGSTNAAALLLAGVGPVLWVVWELMAGRVGWRRASSTVLKVGALSAAVSLWWAAGLAVEGAYGMNILRYTETIPTVARTSLASETLRGLGYWFFYGVDKLGLYLPMSGPYMTSVWLLTVSFAVPAAAFLAAFVARWRERAYFVLLIVVGTVLSVGAHPLADPSPLGQLIKAGATGSTVGLALRSTNRATPLVVLGTAVLLGAGVAAVARRWKVAGVLAATAAAGLVAADMPALWTGQFVAANLAHPETVPAYLTKAADYLDSQPGATQTRVLSEPGIDFATYNWGTTLESVLPGLMTRPEVDRAIVPYGSPGSANLLEAVDEGIQAGTFDPSALAPVLRLMSAGDLVIESDLQYAHYNTPRPRALWQKLDPAPAGLGSPVGFGSPSVTATPPGVYPLIDETELGLPEDAPYPAPVEAFPVANARPILRTEGASAPLLLDGDASGLVSAAGAGLLDGQATVFYSPTFASQPAALQHQLARGADLVVTDSNRRRAEQFGTVQDNFGYTETAGETALVPDGRDARLPLFPASAGDASKTVAVQLGVKSVQASGYGNPITYAPEDRPDQAMDGNLHTNWEVAAFSDPVGQFLRMTLDHAVTTDHVNLVQPLYGPRDRWITRVTLRFDGGRPLTVDLGGASRTSAGQTVTFPARAFTTLQVTIDRTGHSSRNSQGLSGVGFAEVRVSGQQVDEVMRMPQDLLTAAGTASASHRLTLVMTRQTAAPVPPRSDPEIDIARFFTLPTARSFSVSGTAEVSPLVADDVLDNLLGTTVPGIDAVYSSGRLPGAPQDRASSTLDADPASAWSPGLGPQAGNWIEYDLAHPLTFDHLSLSVIADGRHSVPTSVTVSAGGQSRTLALPPLADSTTPWAARTVTVAFPALTGTNVRLTFGTVRQVTDRDYYSDTQVGLPLGIADVVVPGMPRAAAPPATLAGTCRSDLLTVDGVPVPVSITGTTTAASALGALEVRGCGSAAAGITLGAGAHELQTQPGFPPGVDVNVDSLVLDSAPGGAALAPGPADRLQPAQSGPAPTITVERSSATSATVVVHDATGPFWMVLGESTNAGWHATTSTGTDLGPAQLIDGYANGWLVTPTRPGRDMVITLAWTPQRLVSAALVVSGVSLAVCLVVGCLPRRRRRAAPQTEQRRARRLPRAAPSVTVPMGPSGSYRRAAPWTARPTTVLSEPGARSSAGASPAASPVGAPPGGPYVAAPTRQPPVPAPERAGPGDDAAPLLSSPLRSWGTRPRWVGLVVVPVVAGGVAAAVVTPAAGLPVAAGAFLAAVTGYGRLVLAVGAVGLLVAVDRMVAAAQGTFHYAAQFGWPNHFETAGTVAWLAVMALGADALVQEVRARRARAAPRRSRRTSPNHPSRGKHIRRT